MLTTSSYDTDTHLKSMRISNTNLFAVFLNYKNLFWAKLDEIKPDQLGMM